MRYGRALRILGPVADKPKALHAKAGTSRSKVVLVVAIVVLLAAGGTALAYVLTGSKSSGTANAANTDPGVTPTTAGVNFLVQPADGASDVVPGTDVSVTAMSGTILDVVVSGSDGSTLAGAVTPNGSAWHSTGTLALKTDYTVTIDAATSKGKTVQQVTHFDSLVPTVSLGYTLTPSTGLNRRCGRAHRAAPSTTPYPSPAKAALEADLQVTESNPVPGGWHWFDNEELHLRPEVYWPTGEQVTFDANLAGFNAQATGSGPPPTPAPPSPSGTRTSPPPMSRPTR